MRWLRRWGWAAAAVLVAALVIGSGGIWWHSADGLSAEEQVFVGRWSQPVTVVMPNDGLLLYRFHADRTFRFSAVGPDGRPVQGEMAGRWAIANGVLLIEYQAQPSPDLAARFRRLARGQGRMRSERLTVVGADEAGLRLAGAGGNAMILTPDE